MTVTKELVAQWVAECNRMDMGVLTDYIAQRAAAYGAAQRDAELTGVGMEPVAKVATRKGRVWMNFENFSGFEDGKHPLYTAAQLAAARLQGADEMKQLLAEYRETVDSAVERGNQIVLLNARITDLERVNQGLIIALKSCWDLGIDSALVPQVRAAIAAAEKETAWHQDGTTDSAKTTTAGSGHGSQTGSEQEIPAKGTHNPRTHETAPDGLEVVAWMRRDGMKAMPADEKVGWEQSPRHSDVAEDYTVPLVYLTSAQVALSAERVMWQADQKENLLWQAGMQQSINDQSSYITDLERVNQGLLEALKEAHLLLDEGVCDFWSRWDDRANEIIARVRAAIAAAEQEAGHALFTNANKHG